MEIGEVTGRAVLGVGLLCAFATCKPEGLFNGIDASSGGPGTNGSGGAIAIAEPDIGTGGSGAGGSVPGAGGSVPGTGGAAGRATGGTNRTPGTGGEPSGGGGIVGNATGGSGGQGVGGGGRDGATVRVLSIDFVGAITTSAGGAGGVTVTPLTAMGATEVAGFQPAANWNSAPGTTGLLPALILAGGTVTSASVTWNSPPEGTNHGLWRLGYADAPGDVRMMNGYLDPTLPTLPATITVSGLPANMAAGYDVYVYTSGDVLAGQSRTYRYSIGAVTATVTQAGPSLTVFSGYARAPLGGAGNFIVFANVVGPSFTFTATPGTGVPTRAPVNGIQIVSPAGGAI